MCIRDSPCAAASFEVSVECTKRNTRGIGALSHADARAAGTFQNTCSGIEQVGQRAVFAEHAQNLTAARRNGCLLYTSPPPRGGGEVNDKMKQKYDVTGMTCSACSAHVEKAARAIPGVRDVTVNLLTNSMVIESDTQIANSAVIEAVSAAGYGAIPVSYTHLDVYKRQPL